MKKQGKQADSTIVRLILDGDINMYYCIVERYEGKLLRYATYILKDYDIASDVVQETFIKAYINLRSYNSNRRFSPWIYRILHNEAMNAIKRSKKITTIDAVNETDDDFMVHFRADKQMDRKTLNKDVRKCLGNLDIKYKEVLALTYFDNLKYDEISDVLHIPTSTVGVRLKRGKEMLRKICENQGVKYE